GTQSIAILLLTGHQRTEQVVEGLAAGANDYLSKPYAEEELRARVASLVRSKELLERAERAERSLRLVLDTAPDALLALDAEGRVSYANTEAARALGLSLEQIHGKPAKELVPGISLESEHPTTPTSLGDVAIGQDVYAPVVRLFSSDEGGNTTVALRKVTERRKREAQRLDFYAIIAHDLRSPLSSILLRTELLVAGGRGALNDAVITDLLKIKKHVGSLVEWITDFLELARLESPAYQIEKKPVDLVALVADVLDDLQPVIDAAKHSFVSSNDGTSATVIGDRVRLAQVITNLVTNAVKFTPSGGKVRLTVHTIDDQVEVCVEDTGPGIDAAFVPTLTHPYMRASGAKESGTGLGLMIVRQILEAHGSVIHVQTELGQGARFWFRLPKH
ncbi:MAG TPA: ATP-binding protein, partial [Polyangiaceae bacterium]|nr:ATP-binding protein [Polyangiaceae bacterium]